MSGASKDGSGFIVIQGNKISDLRQLMVDYMSAYPLKPLDRHSILVQSNGIAQWVRLALASNPESGGFGIAADLDITLPARMVWTLYRSVLPSIPTVSPFDKGPLTWRIFRLLGDDRNISEAGGVISRYLKLDSRPGSKGLRNRLKLAEQISDLFDQYQIYRSDWLELWEAGKNQIKTPTGQEVAIPESQLWQPHLWRVLVENIKNDDTLGKGVFDRCGRDAVHKAYLEAVSKISGRPSRIPPRITVFGISAMPPKYLETLAAASHLTQVVLFVQNPSRFYWGDLIEGKHLFKIQQRRSMQSKIPDSASIEDMHLYGNPLLAAWGRQGRDYLRLLDIHDDTPSYAHLLKSKQIAADVFSEYHGTTLLSAIQNDILNLTSIQERKDAGLDIDPTDQSIEFLVAHSRNREIEVLHDRLIDQFSLDPDLRPSDILVMVPNVDDYSASIESVFGRYKTTDPRHIPYHISDQGARSQHTLLGAFETIMSSSISRFTSTHMLDLLEVPSIGAKVGISDHLQPKVRAWVDSANVRWGINGNHREELGLPANEENTLLFGLKRMIYGFAMGYSEANYDGVLPLGDVGGIDAEVVGGLHRFVEQMIEHTQSISTPKTPMEWIEYIEGKILADMFQAVSTSDEKALAQISNALQEWLTECEWSNSLDHLFDYTVVRTHLLQSIDRPNLSQKFFAGSVNFATLMPMRAVPFKQIWLLGMNEGEYPRKVTRNNHDLMTSDYRPGDRSRREDDRYLFLEALLSAQHKLVISWNGRSNKDNTDKPPSILVSQLRDYIDSAWSNQADRLSDSLTTLYPLQPYSRRYFEPGRSERVFTYGHEWRNSFNPASNKQAVACAPAEDQQYVLSTADLIRFSCAPVDEFYRVRLGITKSQASMEVRETETFALTGLDSWKIRNEAIQKVFSGKHGAGCNIDSTLEDFKEVLYGSGLIPKSSHGQIMANAALAPVKEMHELRERLLNGMKLVSTKSDLIKHHQSVMLAHNGVSLRVDASNDLYQSESGEISAIAVNPSNLIKSNKYSWKVAIDAWFKHLEWNLILGNVETHLLTPSGHTTIHGMDKEIAKGYLMDALSAYSAGMATPLNIALNTGIAMIETGVYFGEIEVDSLDGNNADLVKKVRAAHSLDQERSQYFANLSADLSDTWNERSFRFVREIYLPVFNSIKTKKAKSTSKAA